MSRRALPLAALLGLLVAGLPPAARAAASGGSLQVCLAAAADYTPVYPTRTFPAGTTDVAAVLRLGRGESYDTMTATFVAVDVGKVAPPNSVIRRIEMRVGGRDRAAVRFRGGDRALPPGRYRLDVAAAGKAWRSVGFTVAAASPAPAVKAPADLLPLTEGTVWTYAFVQEAGPGVTLQQAADLKPGPDGKLRATVTRTVGSADADGTRIEIRRNGVLIEEQWWRLADAGLLVTRRKSGGETTAFDPPGVLLPFPLEAPQGWTYESRDGSIRQAYRIFGPVPVASPAGRVPGYVVVGEQPASITATVTGTLSVEQHVVPGVGTVREVSVLAWNGRMLTREEMVLKAHAPR